MSVNYKFKSAKDFDSVLIDGKCIAIAQLKEKIIHKLKLGNSLDFDLVISNSETDEEYLAEDYLVAENASLLVRRVPRKNETISSKTNLESATSAALAPDIKQNTESGATATPLQNCFKVDGLANTSERLPVFESSISLDEDSKIKEFVDSSAADWIRQTKEAQVNLRGQGSIFLKKVPPQGYICHRCSFAGHYIQHCPTNDDPSYDVKKVKAPSGIPRTMLVANPDGSYALPTGEVAILQPNEEAFAKEIDGVFPKESVTDIPPELCCPLCQKAMKDAVLTSKCCCKSFCDKCIRDVLLEKATCVCGAKNVRADDLLPNKTLRETVERVLSGTLPLISTPDKSQSQDSTTRTDKSVASHCKQENEEEENEEANDEEIEEELDYDGDGFDDLNMDEEYSDKTPESATTKAEEASPKESTEAKERTPLQHPETKEEDERIDTSKHATDGRRKPDVPHRSRGRASVPSYAVQYTGYYAPYGYGFFPAFRPYSGSKAREGFEVRKADLNRRRGYRDHADRGASYGKYTSRHRSPSGTPVKHKPQSSNRHESRSPPRSLSPVKRRSQIRRVRSRSRSRSPPPDASNEVSIVGRRNYNTFVRRARSRSHTRSPPDTPNKGRKRDNWSPRRHLRYDRSRGRKTSSVNVLGSSNPGIHKIQSDSYRSDELVSRYTYHVQAQYRPSKADNSRRWDDSYHVQGEGHRLQSDIGRRYRSSSKDECDSIGDDGYHRSEDRFLRRSNLYENDHGSEGHGYTVLRGARGITELGIDGETYRRHLEDVENPHRPAATERLRSMQMKLTYYKPDGLSRVNHREGDGSSIPLSERFSKLTGTNRDTLTGGDNDDEEDDVSVSCKHPRRRHMENEDNEFLLSREEDGELHVPRRRGKVLGVMSGRTYKRPGPIRFEQDDGLVISTGPTGGRMNRLRSKLSVDPEDDYEDEEMPRKRKLTSRLTEVDDDDRGRKQNRSKVSTFDGRKRNRLMSKSSVEDDQLKRNRLTSRLITVDHAEEDEDEDEVFVHERLVKEVSWKNSRGPIHERLGQALTDGVDRETEDEGRASVRERLGKRVSISERLTKTNSVFERINEDGKRGKGRKAGTGDVSDTQCTDVKSVFERISFSNKGENVRSRMVVMI